MEDIHYRIELRRINQYGMSEYWSSVKADISKEFVIKHWSKLKAFINKLIIKENKKSTAPTKKKSQDLLTLYEKVIKKNDETNEPASFEDKEV